MIGIMYHILGKYKLDVIEKIFNSIRLEAGQICTFSVIPIN